MMESLKDALARVDERLAELETTARKLPNHNFADLIKAARGRLNQASQHPDLDQVEEQLKADLNAQDGLPFGGT